MASNTATRKKVNAAFNSLRWKIPEKSNLRNVLDIGGGDAIRPCQLVNPKRRLSTLILKILRIIAPLICQWRLREQNFKRKFYKCFERYPMARRGVIRSLLVGSVDLRRFVQWELLMGEIRFQLSIPVIEW